MNILQPIKQSKRQFIIVGLITVLLIMACFTTACFGTANDDGLPVNEHTPVPTPDTTSMDTAPSPEITPSTTEQAARAFGPYESFIGSHPTPPNTEGHVTDMLINIPVKKEPMHDYYPVLDVEYSKIDKELMDIFIDYLLGDDYSQNDLNQNEVFSATSSDGDFGLSVWYKTDEYTHLKYFSEDYYFEPVVLLEQGIESRRDYNAEVGVAYDLVGHISMNYILDQILLGKAIPKDMAGEGELDASELEDCVIVRFTPNYLYIAAGYEYMAYTPSTAVISTEERMQKETSSVYDLSNPMTAEYIDIVVQGNKIVDVTWNGYSEVTNITEYDSIVSYDEAFKTFENRVLWRYFWESEITLYYNVVVTDIEFGLVRVENQMIPAYTFIGTQKSIVNGQEIMDYDKTDVASFMIINAIDGSIVRESDMSEK